MTVFASEGFELNNFVVEGTVVTNAEGPRTLLFTNDGYIIGDLYIGPGGDFSVMVGGWGWVYPENNVGGEVFNLNSKRYYSLPKLPEYPEPPQRASLDIFGGPVNDVFINEDGWYPVIRISSDRALTIDVGEGERIIRVGSLIINQGHIVVQGSGTLYLYIDDSFVLEGGSTLASTVNADKPPVAYEQVIIFYRGAGDVSMAGNTKFNGIMCIGSSRLTAYGSNLMYGSIFSQGDRVEVSSSADFYLDVLYAPEAEVTVSGSGIIQGTIISKYFKGSVCGGMARKSDRQNLNQLVSQFID